jgi:hypothetical protein
MDWRRVASMSGWACSVVWMVLGECVMGAGVKASHGGSWMGFLFGDLLDALYKAAEDICVWG